MLRLLALCLLAVSQLSGTEGIFSRACEHEKITLNCGSRVIYIWYASYGLTQKGACAFNGNTRCHAGTSMMVARHECQGQSTCTLHAENSAFGDPCNGTIKHLDVSYYCLKKSQIGFQDSVLLRICEGRSKIISCPSWRPKIWIISANYGRLTGGHICGGSVQTTNCGAARSLVRVRGFCHGRSICSLMAKDGHFDGDPCPGTTKYLEVRYRCVEA